MAISAPDSCGSTSCGTIHHRAQRLPRGGDLVYLSVVIIHHEGTGRFKSQRYPLSLNLNITDIRKRTFSTLRLDSATTNYEGPVIRYIARRLLWTSESRRMLHPSGYQLFDSPRDVPKRFFEDQSLIVERFFGKIDYAIDQTGQAFVLDVNKTAYIASYDPEDQSWIDNLCHDFYIPFTDLLGYLRESAS